MHSFILFAVTLCQLSFADRNFQFHSDPNKAKEVRAALLTIGEITGKQLDDDLITGDRPVDKILGMVDPLVHRYGSEKPFEAALKGPGFSSLDELMAAFNSRQNADVFPKMSTEDWSKELKAVLTPKLNVLGKKKGDDFELTAGQLGDMLFRLSASQVTGTDGRTVDSETLSPKQWDELRDKVGDLALKYRDTLKTKPAREKTPKEKGLGTHTSSPIGRPELSDAEYQAEQSRRAQEEGLKISAACESIKNRFLRVACAQSKQPLSVVNACANVSRHPRVIDQCFKSAKSKDHVVACTGFASNTDVKTGCLKSKQPVEIIYACSQFSESGQNRLRCLDKATSAERVRFCIDFTTHSEERVRCLR